MNYEPNTTTWAIGDLVLHDSDHKSPEMLMRVIGYTKNGLCQTKYISDRFQNSSGRKSRQDMRETWENPLKYLHDPARFDVDTKVLAEANP